MVAGPRVIAAGRVLSQTGGHGDVRARHEVSSPGCGCQIDSDWFAHIADGPDAVRRAARFELRSGAAFLKVMASGGVASPSDPLEAVQYTAEELAAAVVEADHRSTYVTAHAYTPAAIAPAVRAGVACIEHGNLLDAATAELMAEEDVVLVPTLVTYLAMEEVGEKHGLPARNRAKNRGVLEAGLRAVELAAAAGVRLGLGSDLLGESEGLQAREFELRGDLQSAAAVLQAAFVVNAELCGLAGEIGTLSPGAHGDVIVVDEDPTVHVASLARWESNLHAVVQAGRVVFAR
jgi:imidazolonepropionase-like amidohydrolase